VIRKLSNILKEHKSIVELADIFAKHNNVIKILEGKSGIVFVIIDANKLYNFCTRMYDLRMQAYDKDEGNSEQDYTKVKYDADEIYDRMSHEAPPPFESMHTRFYPGSDSRDIPGDFLNEVILQVLRNRNIVSSSFNLKPHGLVNSHNLHYDMPKEKPYNIIMQFSPLNVGVFIKKEDNFGDHIEILDEYSTDQITDMTNNKIHNSYYLEYIKVVDNELYNKIYSETILKEYRVGWDYNCIIVDQELKNKNIIEHIIKILKTYFKHNYDMDRSISLDNFYEGHTTKWVDNTEVNESEPVIKFCEEFDKILYDNPNMCSLKDKAKLLSIFKWGKNKYNKEIKIAGKFGII